jgi:glycosyltransferase involved in cell wall biosynthesis
MKICHITTVHPLNDTRIFFKQCSYLSKLAEVYLIVQHDKDEKLENINILSLPYINSRFKRMMILPLKALKRALTVKADLYQFHDPEFLLIGFIMKIVLRKRVIYDIHELYFDSIENKAYLPQKTGRILGKLYRSIEKFVINFLDGIILAEDGYEDFYRFKKQKIIVRNFLQKKYIYLNALNENRDFKGSNLKFAYLGLINEVRGIKMIIKFAEILKNHFNIEYHIIGNFESQTLEKQIKKLIKDKKLEKFFFFYGRLEQPKALKIIRRCHFGIIFLQNIKNFKTALPTKLFEYMGNGVIPVVNNGIGETEKIMKKYELGFIVDFNNLEEFIFNLSKAITSGDLDAKRKKNLQLVENEFNWESEFLKLVDFYKGVLQNE